MTISRGNFLLAVSAIVGKMLLPREIYRIQWKFLDDPVGNIKLNVKTGKIVYAPYTA